MASLSSKSNVEEKEDSPVDSSDQKKAAESAKMAAGEKKGASNIVLLLRYFELRC